MALFIDFQNLDGVISWLYAGTNIQPMQKEQIVALPSREIMHVGPRSHFSLLRFKILKISSYFIIIKTK